MTHGQFLVSEGGYIADDAPVRIFENAYNLDVRDFVVPGTKIQWVKDLRERLTNLLGDGNYDLYAPGFISQGGDITECGQAAGPRFHAIVGSAIYNKPRDQWRQMAEVLTSQIR
jgi:orotidine-5'-phosphate decarboxylase